MSSCSEMSRLTASNSTAHSPPSCVVGPTLGARDHRLGDYHQTLADLDLPHWLVSVLAPRDDVEPTQEGLMAYLRETEATTILEGIIEGSP